MRTFSYFLAIVASCIVFSCSKSENDPLLPEPEPPVHDSAELYKIVILDSTFSDTAYVADFTYDSQHRIIQLVLQSATEADDIAIQTFTYLSNTDSLAASMKTEGTGTIPNITYYQYDTQGRIILDSSVNKFNATNPGANSIMAMRNSFSGNNVTCTRNIYKLAQPTISDYADTLYTRPVFINGNLVSQIDSNRLEKFSYVYIYDNHPAYVIKGVPRIPYFTRYSRIRTFELDMQFKNNLLTNNYVVTGNIPGNPYSLTYAEESRDVLYHTNGLVKKVDRYFNYDGGGFKKTRRYLYFFR